LRSRPDNNFSALRLGLALLVALGHSQSLAGIPAPQPWPFGYAGVAVECFFVVSGWLVSGGFDRDPDLRRFYIRRFFRLYPLYIAVIAAQTVALAALAPGHAGEALTYFLRNAVFVNYAQNDIGGALTGLRNPSFNASLWTLKIEIAFYAILPFLWFLAKRFGLWPLLLLFLASAIWQKAFQLAYRPGLAGTLPGQLQYFLVGIAAYRWRDRLTLPPLAGTAVAILSATALTVLMLDHTPLLYPLLAGAFVVSLALCTPPLRLHSDISYGIYLIHAPILQSALLAGLYRPGWDEITLLLAVILPLALLLERLIERPGIALGRRLAEKCSVFVPGNMP
jgi:peptidoglycan/LPS O-acetylase OafA/YrhL